MGLFKSRQGAKIVPYYSHFDGCFQMIYYVYIYIHIYIYIYIYIYILMETSIRVTSHKMLQYDLLMKC